MLGKKVKLKDSGQVGWIWAITDPNHPEPIYNVYTGEKIVNSMRDGFEIIEDIHPPVKTKPLTKEMLEEIGKDK